MRRSRGQPVYCLCSLNRLISKRNRKWQLWVNPHFSLMLIDITMVTMQCPLHHVSMCLILWWHLQLSELCTQDTKINTWNRKWCDRAECSHKLMSLMSSLLCVCVCEREGEETTGVSGFTGLWVCVWLILGLSFQAINADWLTKMFWGLFWFDYMNNIIVCIKTHVKVNMIHM